MERFADLTANPSDAKLREILEDLHANPQILIVFNHPLWDLYKIGQKEHERQVRSFIESYGTPSTHWS